MQGSRLGKILHSVGRPNCRGVVAELNNFSVMLAVQLCKPLLNMLAVTPLTHVEKISRGDLRRNIISPPCMMLTVLVCINFHLHCAHSKRCVKSFYAAASLKTVRYLGTW